MVDRLSTRQIYNQFHNNILVNQDLLVSSSNKINSGTSFTNNYEDPRANTLSLDFEGQILQNSQTIINRENALTEVELAENAMASIKNNLDKLKEVAITASNATSDESIFRSYITEVRSIGEAIIQLGNTKSGEQYIFSGKQSNLTTFELLDPNDTFDTTVYKEGNDNGRQKSTEGIDYTFDIREALLGAGSPAEIQGRNLNPTAPAGTLSLSVNDGNDNKFNFDVVFAGGEPLGAIIAAINAAYPGPGTIATNDPTYQLKLDTGLITGNSTNAEAQIVINDTSSQAVLDAFGLGEKSNRGDDIGALRIVAELETALRNGDQSAMQNLIKQIDENTTAILNLRAKMGLTIRRIENSNNINDILGNQLQTALSRVRDVNFVDANLELNTAQSRLQSSIETAASFFNSSLNNFLR
ncbi:MAG: flagellin [Candidatus Caenarcaniphilales bacterium]|nr:flagellin [Candidatus Caenarcaniphilales bacterium]